MTSSVSGKRASQTAPIARGVAAVPAVKLVRTQSYEVETGFEPV